MPKQDYLQIGRVSGVFGIKGWLKVYSFTDNREAIVSYSPWLLKKAGESKWLEVVDGVLQGKALAVQLKDINDRNEAEKWVGWDIFIRSNQLPRPEHGEYYWTDLIGLEVETLNGLKLGEVDSLLETGANDVLIVRGERDRAIPFLQGQTILKIDLQSGKMQVDWDPEF